MKRIFCAFLTCLIGLASLTPSAYAQQPDGTIIFSQQELDQLLAPVALYPDPLLSQVLMAATYPLEVVQAARFVRQNPLLKGDFLARALAGKPWDPSVQALVQFPAVLTMMDDQLAWTQKLGDAFLVQQDGVMDTVQSLRARAQRAGALRSNQQQRIVVQDNIIDIEPYAPDVVYVPYYNPNVVYGGWWWPDRPPMVWVPPPVYRSSSYGNAIAVGIAFGVGVGIVNSIFNDTRPDWREHHFIMNRAPVGNRSSGAGTVWTHRPEHRLGVAYRDVVTRNRFQPPANNNGNRDFYRGHVSPVLPAQQPVVAVPRNGAQMRTDRADDKQPPVRINPASPVARQVEPQHVQNSVNQSRGTQQRTPNSDNQAHVEQPRAPNQINQPRITQPRTEIATPASRPVMRQPIEQVHPFIPAGPARDVQVHAERGRASREASVSNQAPAHSAAERRSGNQPKPQRGDAEREQKRQQSH